MHQWLQDAGVKRGDAKGDKMVQASREVLFKIKNAWWKLFYYSEQRRRMD